MESSSEPTALSKQVQAGSFISRRNMLTTSLTAIAGLAALGNGTLIAQEAQAQEHAQEQNIKDKFSLKGKVSIVTGAARGIGRAIAVALAQAGADVVGVDIAAVASKEVIYTAATMNDLHETERLVKEQHRKFKAIQADIRDMTAVKRMVDDTLREFGKIDILVADAGIQVYASLAQMSDQQWKDVIDVNLTGTTNTVRAVIPAMMGKMNGRIIIIASGQGRHGMADGAAYSASKWGLIGMMKSAALELGEYGITVNCVEPGLVDTAMTRNIGRWKEALKEAGKPYSQNPTEAEVIAARVPTQVMKIPWMQPEDIAPAVVFLATDAAYRISGSTYDVTAGDSAKYTA